MSLLRHVCVFPDLSAAGELPITLGDRSMLRSGSVLPDGGGPPRRGTVEAAPEPERRLKRKASVDCTDQAASSPVATTSRPCPSSSPELVRAPPAQHATGAGEDGGGTDADGDAAVAELGVKLFPSLPPDQAAEMWCGFVKDAKTCIKHYNSEHKANFVYKHAPAHNGFYRVEEQDGRSYYHMNFLAQDKDGNSDIFFGEIRERVVPTVEDVTCCCPVLSSDAGGKGFRTIEEALNFEYPDVNTVGYDPEYCYACTSRTKHPKGTRYVAGHFADVRQYYGF
ncbi:hypothetical protein ACP4OV_027066 [Aristida adscensionis]